MTDVVFVPIPSQLMFQVEPAAGEVLPRGRRRVRDEFHPDWSYIMSPSASTVAVVAALTLSAHDVDDRMWEAVLRVHVPAAMGLLDSAGFRWVDVNEGRIPALSGVSNQFARLVNETLGGFEVLHMFPVADMLEAVEASLGDVSFSG